jgi:hypothetical protein
MLKTAMERNAQQTPGCARKRRTIQNCRSDCIGRDPSGTVRSFAKASIFSFAYREARMLSPQVSKMKPERGSSEPIPIACKISPRHLRRICCGSSLRIAELLFRGQAPNQMAAPTTTVASPKQRCSSSLAFGEALMKRHHVFAIEEIGEQCREKDAAMKKKRMPLFKGACLLHLALPVRCSDRQL